MLISCHPLQKLMDSVQIFNLGVDSPTLGSPLMEWRPGWPHFCWPSATDSGQWPPSPLPLKTDCCMEHHNLWRGVHLR